MVKSVTNMALCKKIIFSLCCFSLLGCDILRNGQFEVMNWSPGSGVKNDNVNHVSLTFSKDADRGSVEKAFTFTEDGAKLSGAFSWEGNTLKFTPSYPLIKNKDYEIVLDTTASASDGLSLEIRFEGSFTTRTDNDRPAVISILPNDDAVVKSKRSKIVIEFSMAVDLNSCNNDISITPLMSGVWSLENENKNAVFEPVEAWKEGEKYTVKVTSFLQSSGGKTTGCETQARFTVGDDKTPPTLYKKQTKAINAEGNEVKTLEVYDKKNSDSLSALTEMQEWEKDYKLTLWFSENVDADKIKNFIKTEPTLKFELTPNYGWEDKYIMNFTETPVWDARYNIKISSGFSDKSGNLNDESVIYKIHANGPCSKPPELVAIRVLLNPNEVSTLVNTDESSNIYEIFDKDNPYEAFNLDVGTYKCNTWIELYFDTAISTADNAAFANINLFSLMDLFQLKNTNNTLEFSPERITDFAFTIKDPADAYKENQRIEIRGELKNSKTSGLVTFYIGKGLKDSNGNENQNEMKIVVRK